MFKGKSAEQWRRRSNAWMAACLFATLSTIPAVVFLPDTWASVWFVWSLVGVELVFGWRANRCGRYHRMAEQSAYIDRQIKIDL